MIMMPYSRCWSLLQLTGHADFWHPTARGTVMRLVLPEDLARARWTVLVPYVLIRTNDLRGTYLGPCARNQVTGNLPGTVQTAGMAGLREITDEWLRLRCHQQRSGPALGVSRGPAARASLAQPHDDHAGRDPARPLRRAGRLVRGAGVRLRQGCHRPAQGACGGRPGVPELLRRPWPGHVRAHEQVRQAGRLLPTANGMAGTGTPRTSRTAAGPAAATAANAAAAAPGTAAVAAAQTMAGAAGTPAAADAPAGTRATARTRTA